MRFLSGKSLWSTLCLEWKQKYSYLRFFKSFFSIALFKKELSNSNTFTRCFLLFCFKLFWFFNLIEFCSCKKFTPESFHCYSKFTTEIIFAISVFLTLWSKSRVKCIFLAIWNNFKVKNFIVFNVLEYFEWNNFFSYQNFVEFFFFFKRG